MAYNEPRACCSNAFSLNFTILYRVEFALSQMRNPAIPRQLAAFKFLRLITTSMQAFHRQGSDLMIASAIAPTYLSLASELTGRDPRMVEAMSPAGERIPAKRGSLDRLQPTSPQ